MSIKLGKLCAILLTLGILISCTEEEEEEKKAKQAKMKIEVLSASSASASARLYRQTSTATTGTSNAATNLIAGGHASAGNLESLQYYIRDISICKNMTITGTGYSNPEGCILIYSETASNDYNTYLADNASADTTNYINLMDSASRATLASTITLNENSVGEYNFGKVDFYRPIKVKASVPVNNGETYYTKNGTVTAVSGSGIDTRYENQVQNMNVGPAEESVIVLPNGGNWFRFQSPWTLSQSDIDNEVTFQMKLNFNPEGLIKAYQKASNQNPIVDSNTGSVIAVPLIDLAPIIYRADETALKESYLLHYSGEGTSPAFDVRLELYSIVGDANKTIYSVESRTLFTGATQLKEGEVLYDQKISYITTNADGSLSFQNHFPEDVFSGFSRLTQVGSTGTANIVCASFCLIPGKHGVTGSFPVTTELVAIQEIASDASGQTIFESLVTVPEEENNSSDE